MEQNSVGLGEGSLPSSQFVLWAVTPRMAHLLPQPNSQHGSTWGGERPPHRHLYVTHQTHPSPAQEPKVTWSERAPPHP